MTPWRAPNVSVCVTCMIALVMTALGPRAVAHQPCPEFEPGTRVRTLFPLIGRGDRQHALTVVAVAGDHVVVDGEALHVNGIVWEAPVPHRPRQEPARWEVTVDPCSVALLAGAEVLDELPRSYGVIGTYMLEAIEGAGHNDPTEHTWTETRIRNAIAFGEQTPPRELHRHISLLAKRTLDDERPRRIGALSTPLTRVAMAASHARQRGARLRVADVKAEWLEPTLHVYVCARVDNGFGTPPIRVSLRPAGGASDGTAAPPIAADRVMPVPSEYHQMFFDHYQVTVDHGVLAIFPLSALRTDREVYVEYLEPTPLCPACAAALPSQPAERGR